jgi:hypothetical protein
MCFLQSSSFLSSSSPLFNGKFLEFHLFCVFFKTVSCYVTLAGLKSVILLPQPPKCWCYRCVVAHLALSSTLSHSDLLNMGDTHLHKPASIIFCYCILSILSHFPDVFPVFLILSRKTSLHTAAPKSSQTQQVRTLTHHKIMLNDLQFQSEA